MAEGMIRHRPLMQDEAPRHPEIPCSLHVHTAKGEGGEINQALALIWSPYKALTFPNHLISAVGTEFLLHPLQMQPCCSTIPPCPAFPKHSSHPREVHFIKNLPSRAVIPSGPGDPPLYIP